jgi:thiopurine S-methyltransferase
VAHFDHLKLQIGSRIFLPLCGKTLDIAWLLDAGYQVAGAELSEVAVEELFADLGTQPRITSQGELTVYKSEQIEIFVGDIFNLTVDLLGIIGAIYDRAALVALPLDMRVRYTSHIRAITDNTKQLLICIEYDQDLMTGPPFSITKNEVKEHYASAYKITLLESSDMKGGFKGGFKGELPAAESVWLLL